MCRRIPDRSAKTSKGLNVAVSIQEEPRINPLDTEGVAATVAEHLRHFFSKFEDDVKGSDTSQRVIVPSTVSAPLSRTALTFSEQLIDTDRGGNAHRRLRLNRRRFIFYPKRILHNKTAAATAAATAATATANVASAAAAAAPRGGAFTARRWSGSCNQRTPAN